MRMRIIAGTKRGMMLFCPKTRITRPITDRVKESLFMVLQNHDVLSGASVADLFCGVGSLGLEALSRGAALVTFVENSTEILTALEKNIAKAGFADRAHVVRASAFRVGAPVHSGAERYNLVFVDPPYVATREVGKGSQLADLFHVLRGQVAGGGVVAVRTHHSVALLDDFEPFRVIDRRRWGTMSIVLLQAGADDEPTSSH